MDDQAGDVRADANFHIKCIYDQRGKRQWALFDTDHITMRDQKRENVQWFVHGLWRGMSIHGEVDLTCAVYDMRGNLIDTMVSKDLLKADEDAGFI